MEEGGEDQWEAEWMMLLSEAQRSQRLEQIL